MSVIAKIDRLPNLTLIIYLYDSFSGRVDDAAECSKNTPFTAAKYIHRIGPSIHIMNG